MGEKIFKFFKKIFGRRAELERKVALLEINYDLLKKQYEELNNTVEEVKKQHEELNKTVEELKTVSHNTPAEDEQPSPQQILDEWLNGGKE